MVDWVSWPPRGSNWNWVIVALWLYAVVISVRRGHTLNTAVAGFALGVRSTYAGAREA